jgi:hypothetical protein
MLSVKAPLAVHPLLTSLAPVHGLPGACAGAQAAPAVAPVIERVPPDTACMLQLFWFVPGRKLWQVTFAHDEGVRTEPTIQALDGGLAWAAGACCMLLPSSRQRAPCVLQSALPAAVGACL